MERKKASESRVIHTHLILPGETNKHNTLYGGHLMSMIDNVAGISFIRHTRTFGVTASMDRLNFIQPLPVNSSLTIESVVSGTGRTSVEVFVKVIGENLESSSRFLAATAFLTFTAVSDEGINIPQVEPVTEEDAFVMEGYHERRQERLKQLKSDRVFQQNIAIDNPLLG